MDVLDPSSLMYVYPYPLDRLTTNGVLAWLTPLKTALAKSLQWRNQERKLPGRSALGY